MTKLILGFVIFIIGTVFFKKSISLMYKNQRHHSGEGKMEAEAEYQKQLRSNPEKVNSNGSEQEFILEHVKNNKPSIGKAIILFVVSFILIIPGCGIMISGAFTG